MKTCPKCKKENLDDATYCAFCGARLNDENVATSIEVNPFSKQQTMGNAEANMPDWMKKAGLASPFSKSRGAKSMSVGVAIISNIFTLIIGGFLALIAKAGIVGSGKANVGGIVFIVIGAMVSLACLGYPLLRLFTKRGKLMFNLIWLTIDILALVALALIVVFVEVKL